MKSFNIFLKQLSESYIIEAISDLKIQYKNIPEDIFDKAIEQDPTYIPGSPKPGQYTLWILNLINNYYKNIKNNQNYKTLLKQYPDGQINGKQISEPPLLTQLKPTDIHKIKSELLKFNKYKKYLNKNINQFKDLSELTKANNSIENAGLSTNQKVLKGIDLFKKAEQKGLEIVFNNKNWLVGIPKTKESSVVFANDTKWCTTQNSEKYYEEYTNDGPLYINLDKKTGDLYQFHFESDSFMDVNDKSISKSDLFIKNPDLEKFYFNTLVLKGIDLFKKAEKLGLRIVFNNKNWIVGIPETKESCVVFANDTKWYTTLKNETYYEKYTSKGPLYINLNKKTGDLYQFHFESDSFKGANNENISKSYFFKEYPELEKFYFNVNGIDVNTEINKILKTVKTIEINTLPKNLSYNITDLIIPNNITNISKYAFIPCLNLKSISIPGSIKEIEIKAFEDCNNLQTVNISNGVTTFGNYVFHNCRNLTDINIPNSVKKIGNYAFFGCKNLKSISIPDSITEINEGTFCGCENFQSIIIPDNVKKIENYAFFGCKNLKSISIPDSITEISKPNAFEKCEIKEIYVRGNPDNLQPTVKQNIKAGCGRDVKIYCI